LVTLRVLVESVRHALFDIVLLARSWALKVGRKVLESQSKALVKCSGGNTEGVR
jgi:hypothetical protein